MYFGAKHGRASESVYVGGRLASKSFFFFFFKMEMDQRIPKALCRRVQKDNAARHRLHDCSLSCCCCLVGKVSAAAAAAVPVLLGNHQYDCF